MVTTRAAGNMAQAAGREQIAALIPTPPLWLQQVHGTGVVDADALTKESGQRPRADAAVTHAARTVCAVMVADCMPVFFSSQTGSAVGVAHAGWRGLCAGVLEATVAALGEPAANLLAWMGPAIGARVYEVGDEVREAFISRDPRAARAFVTTRAGHWLLDLYAIARQRLEDCGVPSVRGAGFCTYSDAARFYSYRRDGSPERMAALIWLT
jgi:YfiH family protein